MRGHGYTATSTLDVEFNMWSVAEDVYAGMVSSVAKGGFFG
jgi:hypothetical protein